MGYSDIMANTIGILGLATKYIKRIISEPSKPEILNIENNLIVEETQERIPDECAIEDDDDNDSMIYWEPRQHQARTLPIDIIYPSKTKDCFGYDIPKWFDQSTEQPPAEYMRALKYLQLLQHRKRLSQDIYGLAKNEQRQNQPERARSEWWDQSWGEWRPESDAFEDDRFGGW